MTSAVDPAVLNHGNKGEGADNLMLKLDDLFVQYLNLLDQYQNARQQLSAHLSSGCLSLAQANFASNSRAKYGPDYYDERMQASRKIAIAEMGTREEDIVVTCKLEAEHPAAPVLNSEPDPQKQSLENFNEDKKQNQREKEANERPKIDPRDPIRWFGLLVPPPLRSAQSKFIEIVEDDVPQLVNLTRELRALEIGIGRTRKSIKKLEK